MTFSYQFKRHFLRILKEYKGKSYQDYLTQEYPITDLVRTEDDLLDVEVILFEKHRDVLLLGLEVTPRSAHRFICGRSIRRTFAVHRR